MNSPEPQPGRIGWRWSRLASAAVTVLVIGWRLVPLIGHQGALFTSDPGDLGSYGFDLSGLTVDRALLVGGARRDELGALVDPKAITTAEADALTQKRRRNHQGKFLVAGDRVVGVEINGEARAYPLRILNWHEVINDTVGGIPIAVTFSGLCDSAVVVDRRLNNEVVTFATSGLLYNSNLVIYDRRHDRAEESLWSQLLLRAVAGPAVGDALTPLPMSLATWQNWRVKHPATSVIVGRNDYLSLYKRDPYGAYLRNPGLKFPVQPQAPTDAGKPATKAKIVALKTAQGWQVFPLQANGALTSGDARLEVFSADDSGAPTFVASGKPTPTIHSLWFAWYAAHGDNGLVTGEQAHTTRAKRRSRRSLDQGRTLFQPAGFANSPGLASSQRGFSQR